VTLVSLPWSRSHPCLTERFFVYRQGRRLSGHSKGAGLIETDLDVLSIGLIFSFQ